MQKLKVQAQYLQPGDIVGSGEKVQAVVVNSLRWHSNKVCVETNLRRVLWGKYTMIGVTREEA